MVARTAAGPEDLRQRLEAVSDPARAGQVARYLKLANREVLGVAVPATHGVALAYVRAHGLPSDLELIQGWFRASFEEALCAIEFLAAQPTYTDDTWEITGRWCAAPDTWALADPISAILVAGHLEAGVIDEALLRAWGAREEPFWFRRIALVSTTSLNGGLGGPTRRQLRQLGRCPEIGATPRPKLTFDLLDASMPDARHFIRLGIGWTLRELSAVDPQGVARWAQRNRPQLTKAMLNKARLDERGRRTQRATA